MSKIFHLIFKLLKLVLVSLFSAILLYFISALILSVLKTPPPKLNCLAENEIFITTNGIHVDIILPKENINLREFGLGKDTNMLFINNFFQIEFWFFIQE